MSSLVLCIALEWVAVTNSRLSPGYIVCTRQCQIQTQPAGTFDCTYKYVYWSVSYNDWQIVEWILQQNADQINYEKVDSCSCRKFRAIHVHITSSYQPSVPFIRQ